MICKVNFKVLPTQYLRASYNYANSKIFIVKNLRYFLIEFLVFEYWRALIFWVEGEEEVSY